VSTTMNVYQNYPGESSVVFVSDGYADILQLSRATFNDLGRPAQIVMDVTVPAPAAAEEPAPEPEPVSEDPEPAEPTPDDPAPTDPVQE
jgi:hypothetical protein